MLWSEDGLVQRPKHVVSLNKDNIKSLCFDLKEPLLIVGTSSEFKPLHEESVFGVLSY